jgi:formate-dependent phosphoribosylglycinamide formyltransferase (GAR transformylase)
MGVALATDATVDQARAKALRVSGAIRVKAA